MADIPGIKQISALAQQPVALVPGKPMNMGLSKQYSLEIDFEDGSMLNVPITESLYNQYLEALRNNNVVIAQSVVARGEVTPSGRQPKPAAELVPLNAAPLSEDVRGALQKATWARENIYPEDVGDLDEVLGGTLLGAKEPEPKT